MVIISATVMEMEKTKHDTTMTRNPSDCHLFKKINFSFKTLFDLILFLFVTFLKTFKKEMTY